MYKCCHTWNLQCGANPNNSLAQFAIGGERLESFQISIGPPEHRRIDRPTRISPLRPLVRTEASAQ